MTSCEHSRSSAYDKNLRWHIVWQKEGLGLSDDTIASNLNIDKSTVSRTVQRFITTGTVAKLPYPKETVTRKLTDPAKLFIFNLVLSSPGISLREIQEELLYTLLIHIDVTNICRLLQQNGFTRQKLKICALQRSEFLRQCYYGRSFNLQPRNAWMKLEQIEEILSKGIVTVYAESHL